MARFENDQCEGFQNILKSQRRYHIYNQVFKHVPEKKKKKVILFNYRTKSWAQLLSNYWGHLKKENKYCTSKLNRTKHKFTLWQVEGPLDYKSSTRTTSLYCLCIHSMEHTCTSVPRDTWVFHSVKLGGRVVQLIVLVPCPVGQATLELRS